MSPRFGAGVSTEENPREALAEAFEKASASLGSARADLAFLFVSSRHEPALEDLVSLARGRAGGGTLLGCMAEGLIGEDREIEGGGGVAAWLASLPGASVRTFWIRAEVEGDGVSLRGLPKRPSAESKIRAVLLLADPFSFPAEPFFDALEKRFPGAPLLGGLASGGAGPGGNRLILDDRILEEGAVGAALEGPVEVRAIVSQGCRPIGRHFVVTKAERNVIFELGGKPALAQLEEVLRSASERDRRLARRALHVGRAVDEYKSEFGRGDFLVRSLLGADPKAGAIAIGDFVRLGQTVQFQVRDAESADEDLRTLLEEEKRARGGRPPDGALLFSCNGRGTNLFGAPHHDARAVRQVAGTIPVAGFFASGEIGPIGSHAFLHGFTASLALFYGGEAPAEEPAA